MRELRPGVWQWLSPHPDWNGDEEWPELVSSYAVELEDEFVSGVAQVADLLPEPIRRLLHKRVA